MTVFPGYDAWKLATPDDGPVITGTISTPLMIEAGDVQIDAIGEYEAGTGALVSVRINGREIAVHAVEGALDVLAPGATGPWSDDLDAARLTELCNEAMQDAADERGDYLRDLRMDG